MHLLWGNFEGEFSVRLPDGSFRIIMVGGGEDGEKIDLKYELAKYSETRFVSHNIILEPEEHLNIEFPPNRKGETRKATLYADGQWYLRVGDLISRPAANFD